MVDALGRQSAEERQHSEKVGPGVKSQCEESVSTALGHEEAVEMTKQVETHKKIFIFCVRFPPHIWKNAFRAFAYFLAYSGYNFDMP